jgi:hypothetical protein
MVYTGLSMSLNRRARGEVVVVFLRLGSTAFGGPAVHVALPAPTRPLGLVGSVAIGIARALIAP